METLRESFANNVRKRRNELGFSQENLAFMCGLHRTYISDIERATRNVSVDNIEKIARSLKIAPSKLLEQEGK